MNTSGIANRIPELGLYVTLANTATHGSVNGNYVCNQETLSVSWAALERRDLLDGELFLTDASSSGVSGRQSANGCQEATFLTSLRCDAETQKRTTILRIMLTVVQILSNQERIPHASSVHLHTKVPACAICC